MNSRRFLRSALAVGLLSVVLCAASSARSYGNASVSGVVRRGNHPIRSVWVIVNQNGAEKGRFLTGDDGQYYIGNLDGGGYEIRVEQQGRPIYKAPINVPAGAKYSWEINL